MNLLYRSMQFLTLEFYEVHLQTKSCMLISELFDECDVLAPKAAIVADFGVKLCSSLR